MKCFKKILKIFFVFVHDFFKITLKEIASIKNFPWLAWLEWLRNFAIFMKDLNKNLGIKVSLQDF